MDLGLIPLEEQAQKVGIPVLNTAFATLWLGQSIPPFTTPKFALAPFKTLDSEDSPGANQTLSATTTMYYTDLECNPPAHITTNKTSGGISFDDGAGCNVKNIIPFPDLASGVTGFFGGASPESPARTFKAYYIGYNYEPQVLNSSLSSAGCSVEGLHSFLAVWKVASNDPPDFSDPTNATALFCKPAYYMQRVNATISIPENTVLGTTPLSPSQPLPAETFNTTQFEFLLSTGFPPSFDVNAHQDVVDSQGLSQDAQLQNLSLSTQGLASTMIGFAVGSTHFPPEEYMQPDKLIGAFRSAHQLVFAVAMQGLFTSSKNVTSVSGRLTTTVEAVTVVPVFAWLALVFLVLIVGCTIWLLYEAVSRPSRLVRDPDSLSEIMKLSYNEALQRLFAVHDVSNEAELEEDLDAASFALRDGIDSLETGPMLSLYTKDPRDRHHEKGCAVIAPKTSRREKQKAELVRPTEYSLNVGVPFCLSLAALIIILIFLHEKTIRENGMCQDRRNML